MTTPVFVGREAELARFQRALGLAASGTPVVTLVAGEAGVGKTRLVREVAAVARRKRFEVCVGRCLDLGPVNWPLAPWREIVGTLSTDLDDEALDLVLGGARGVFASFVPELGLRAVESDPVAPERMCQLIVAVVRRLSGRGPLMLVVEDLHWADVTTLTAFSALARVAGIGPLLLVGTFRDDAVRRHTPLLPVVAEVERTGRCERIDLRPFDHSTTAALLNSITCTPGSLDVDDIHRRSGGNAFFIEELAAAKELRMGVPQTLRDVMLARTVDLDDAMLHLLEVAAVAGPTVPGVLADACGFDEHAVLAMLRRLYVFGLLLPDGDEVRFRHELGREIFAGELLPGDRAGVHARLASSLERRRPERLSEIARHWSATADSERALVALVNAGLGALRIGAAADAESHLVRALSLWDRVNGAEKLTAIDHPGLLMEAATAAEHAGHIEGATELLVRATTELAGIDPRREAVACLDLRDLYRFRHRWEECDAVVARALELIPDTPPSEIRAEALAVASLNHCLAGRPALALELARDAVAVADAAGDRAMIVKAHDALVAALGSNGDAAGALAVAVRNLRRCDGSLPPERIAGAYNAVTGQLAALDRWAEIPPYAQRLVEVARDTGLGGARASWVAVQWIDSLILLGRWKEAEELAADLSDLLSHPTVAGDLAGSLGMALLRQGRVDEARPVIEEARAAFSPGAWSPPNPWHAIPIIALEGIDGNHDVGAIVDRVLAEGETGGCDEVAMVATAIMVITDHVVAAGGRPGSDIVTVNEARASSWVRECDAIAARQRWVRRSERLARAHAACELDRLSGRDGPAAWGRLADGWADLGFAYDEAYSRYRQAASVLAGNSGREARARRHATAALATASPIAQRLGATPLLRRIEDLAGRGRLPIELTIPPQRPVIDAAGTALAGLTDREQAVLGLLASGRTNGQIAQELFISTKTASVHVSNILRKLNVSNRIEAAAIVSTSRDC